MNSENLEHYEKVGRPVNDMVDRIINRLLEVETVCVRLINRSGSPLRLKHNTQVGRLLKVSQGGKMWKVIPDGYTRPQEYFAGYWELDL